MHPRETLNQSQGRENPNNQTAKGEFTTMTNETTPTPSENTNSANGANDETELTAKGKETSTNDILTNEEKLKVVQKAVKDFESKCKASPLWYEINVFMTSIIRGVKTTTGDPQRILNFYTKSRKELDFEKMLTAIWNEEREQIREYTLTVKDKEKELEQLLKELNLIKQENEPATNTNARQQALTALTVEALKQDTITQGLTYKMFTAKFANALQEIEPAKELTKFTVRQTKRQQINIYYSFMDTGAIDEQLERPLNYIEMLVLRACTSLYMQGITTITINQIYSHMVGGVEDKNGKIKTRKASRGVKNDIEKALRHLKAIMIKLDCLEHFQDNKIDREKVDKQLLENGLHRSLLDTVEIAIKTANGKLEKGVQIVAPPPLYLYTKELNQINSIETSTNRLAFENNNIKATLQNIWLRDYLLHRDNTLSYKKKTEKDKSKLKNYRNIDMQRVYKLLGKENSSRKVKRAINKNTKEIMNCYGLKFNLTNESK